MDIRDNVTSLFEHKLNKQRIKDDELESKRFEYSQQCDALFVRQHSDDDSFINNKEFEFNKTD